jgi:hypothetical protein
MPVVWRRTCGVTVLVERVGQLRLAVAACLATKRATASRLSARPRLVGNSGASGSPARSRIQARRMSSVCWVSGVMRSLRPLPSVWTCGAAVRLTSRQGSAVSSETRNTVWTASNISV